MYLVKKQRQSLETMLIYLEDLTKNYNTNLWPVPPPNESLTASTLAQMVSHKDATNQTRSSSPVIELALSDNVFDATEGTFDLLADSVSAFDKESLDSAKPPTKTDDDSQEAQKPTEEVVNRDATDSAEQTSDSSLLNCLEENESSFEEVNEGDYESKLEQLREELKTLDMQKKQQ